MFLNYSGTVHNTLITQSFSELFVIGISYLISSKTGALKSMTAFTGFGITENYKLKFKLLILKKPNI